MAKGKFNFKCSECGQLEIKWSGQCKGCKKWNTLEDYFEQPVAAVVNTKVRQVEGTPKRLREIDSTEEDRMTTGFNEFDRVLGGGIVSGEMILLTGDPGIGKSTVLMQTAHNIAENKLEGDVLYVSGEESLKQIKLRATRLGANSEKIVLVSETNIMHVKKLVHDIKPKLLIIDSIQTMLDPETKGSATGVSQIRACTAELMELGNTTNTPMIIVGHVTKEGDLAGPRNLEHMVDCVIYFEGSRDNQIRMLRTVKNRFGSTDEVGIFEMTSDGLVEKENPSELFMSDGEIYAGSATVITVEGTRPIMAEVQALASQTIYNYPKRMAQGIDNNKLTLICASLERKVGVPLATFDVYIKTVGGLKFSETVVDLSVAIAIVSSLKDIPVPEKTIVLGEVGLVGEVRKVSYIERRIKEAVRFGWKNIVMPNQELSVEFLKELEEKEVTLHKVRNVQEAIRVLGIA